MKDQKGFILLTVLIVVFVLSSLGILRVTLSASRTVDVLRYENELQLLALAETGLSRAQSVAADPEALYANCDNEYYLGEGTYIITANVSGFLHKIVTVNSYIPNREKMKLMKTVVIEGVSITSNYVWREH